MQGASSCLWNIYDNGLELQQQQQQLLLLLLQQQTSLTQRDTQPCGTVRECLYTSMHVHTGGQTTWQHNVPVVHRRHNNNSIGNVRKTLSRQAIIQYTVVKRSKYYSHVTIRQETHKTGNSKYWKRQQLNVSNYKISNIFYIHKQHAFSALTLVGWASRRASGLQKNE